MRLTYRYYTYKIVSFFISVKMEVKCFMLVSKSIFLVMYERNLSLKSKRRLLLASRRMGTGNNREWKYTENIKEHF